MWVNCPFNLTYFNQFKLPMSDSLQVKYMGQIDKRVILQLVPLLAMVLYFTLENYL